MKHNKQIVMNESILRIVFQPRFSGEVEHLVKIKVRKMGVKVRDMG